MLCFFFNDTATTEIYTLSLHDALPIYRPGEPAAPGGHRSETGRRAHVGRGLRDCRTRHRFRGCRPECRAVGRSEEHTSELQSRQYLVCRLLLEKKNTTHTLHSVSLSPS